MRTPSQEVVDAVFHKVYRNCTDDIKGLSVQEEKRGAVGNSMGIEKSQKTKGFLSGGSRIPMR